MGPAVGAALAAKLRGSDAVAVSFIGEGAANQGAFHESLNLAAIWKAPVVFVIEDNAYGISVAKRDSTAVERNAVRAQSYGVPGVFVPGNDADAIFSAAGEAVQRAREGAGPTLLEIETCRLEGHFMGDAEQYRPQGEVEQLKAVDPIVRYRQRLLDQGVSAGELDAGEARVRDEVAAAFAFARGSSAPAPRTAYEKVFVTGAMS